MSFLEFVAIKQIRSSVGTIDHKSMSSFLASARGNDDMTLEDLLKGWIANMIDRSLAVASRKRYVEKLSSIYKEYGKENNVSDNPFEGVKDMCAFSVPENARSLQSDLSKIENAFDAIMTDAASRPELAVFLYLLFNASSDIERAISLTTDEYKSEFRQLDGVIRQADFHHRRKYVFDLNQSRKRMPQLVREVNHAIDFYLHTKGIFLSDGFSHKAIMSLWIAKARKCGVVLADLNRMISDLPAEYEYIRFAKGSKFTEEDAVSIKHRVAESFAPSGKRWYAIKLRRGASYDAFTVSVKDNLNEYDNLLFYPQQEIIRRIEKRIVAKIVPVIPDVVFIHISPRYIGKVDALIKSERSGYVFRVSYKQDSGYSVIDNRSMAGFQHMIGVFTPDVKVGLTEASPVGVGRKVRITGGIMEGYEGTIYDIKEGSDMRHIYIRLSGKYSIRTEVKVEECYVKAIR